jgi:predicted TIM-barrel fold metal-dependent hydrolase
MRHLWLAAVVLTGCAPTPSILPSTSPAQTSQPGADKIRLVDHHVHLFSAPVREWLETELKLPPLPPSGLDEFMAVMQQDGVTKAAVLSNAYFFGKDTDKHPHDLQVLMEENDRIAAAVAQHPDRLVGFFSVNPLMNAARAEIDRCARSRKFVGLKLHLANSQARVSNGRAERHLGAGGCAFRRRAYGDYSLASVDDREKE